MVSPVGDKFFDRGERCSPVSYLQSLRYPPYYFLHFSNHVGDATLPCRKIASLGVGYPTLFGAVIPHSSFPIPHSAPLGAAMSLLTPHSSLKPLLT